MKLSRFWKKAILIFIIGGRGIGKTDLWLRVACELWQQYGCKTMWIRNKKVELSDDGNYENFLTDAKRFGWSPEEWDARSDGVYLSEEKDAERIIDFQSISTFSNKRGGAHPDTLLMVLDEMIPEDRRYPKMCAQGLLSLANTVLRGREGARIVALSNFVSAANPYFARFEVYPSREHDVTVYEEKAIIIERCRGYKKAVKKESPFTKLMRAGRMSMYESEDEDPLLGLIENVPKGAIPLGFFFLIDGKLYREWDSEGLRYFDEWRGQVKQGSLIYTPNVEECDKGVQLVPSFLDKHLRETMQLNLMRFKSPNVMFKILNMIYSTV
jgi:hypothetical protein